MSGKEAGRGGIILRRWVAMALTCFSLSGCAYFWDDVTSRDFHFSDLTGRTNPFLVLRDSEDGYRRARALRALEEPKQHGGSDRDQDAVVNILTAAATTERQPLCRLAAIEALGSFKDPRAVHALQEAYFNAGNFPKDKGASAELSGFLSPCWRIRRHPRRRPRANASNSWMSASPPPEHSETSKTIKRLRRWFMC